MPRVRVPGVCRLLTLFAAIVVAATIVPAVGAGAVPPVPALAPAAAPADTPAPIPPTSPTSPTGPTSPASPATPTTPGTSPFPPTAPGDLHVSAVTSASITLAWTASTPGCCPVQGYDVTYTQAFNDIVWVQDVGNVTTFTFRSSIRPATQYTFRVSARDGLGHRSASSNSITVVTPLSDSGPDTTPPAAPAGLTVAGVTSAGAALTWSASTDDIGVTGYHVYRFDGLFVSTLLATVAGTSYTAPPASPRDIFYVRARDAAGNVSIASNVVTVTSTTTPTVAPSSPPPCRVTYAIGSQWAGGFVADLTVTNTTQTPVTGWTVSFSFGGDQRIASVWNARVSQTGTAVTLTNAGWNSVIPAGGSASLGILGSWTSSNAAPTAISLNGSPCTVG